jgi:hypothetical protein
MESAPSPEPAPSVIKAHHVDPKYIKNCNINDEQNTINISIFNSNIEFQKIIDINDNNGIWNEISKYFQNDIHKFYSIVDSCFKDDHQDVKLKIIQNDPKSLILKFTYGGLFGFTFNIVVNKKIDIIDKLALEIDELKKENKILTEKYSSIMDVLRSHTNWINEDFIWLELDNVCIVQPADINQLGEDYSGEVESNFEKVKDRMLKNRYTTCQRNGNMRNYYFKYNWKMSLNQLKPLNPNCTEYTKVYIKIPKDDITNINHGLGEVSIDKDEKTYFHGHSRRQGYGESLCHNMIVCHGEYIKAWEGVKGGAIPRDRSRNDPQVYNVTRGPLDVFRKLFDLEMKNNNYSNIIMPINYYCNNCKKVDEYFPEGKGKKKPGWEIFQCLGH